MKRLWVLDRCLDKKKRFQDVTLDYWTSLCVFFMLILMNTIVSCTPTNQRILSSDSICLPSLSLTDILSLVAQAQRDRCQVWLMRLHTRLSDSAKDLEICTVRCALDAPPGKVCLAALERRPA